MVRKNLKSCEEGELGNEGEEVFTFVDVGTVMVCFYAAVGVGCIDVEGVEVGT